MPKIFLRESFSNSIIPISEKVRDKRGRAGFTIFLPSYFLSQYGNISERNLFVLCSKKNSVAMKFIDERGGEYQDFPSTTFCLRVPKKLVVESICVS